MSANPAESFVNQEGEAPVQGFLHHAEGDLEHLGATLLAEGPSWPD